MRTQRVLFASLTLTVFLLVTLAPALAATSPKQKPTQQAFITWKALTVAPLGYVGRILNNRTSMVKVAVVVIKDGVPADINAKQINWHINNKFFAGGRGMTTITIPSEDSPQKRMLIRAFVQDTPTDDLIATTSISRDAPVVSLLGPAPEKQRDARLTLRAIPHFFTDTEGEPLQYRWNVDGQIRSIVDDVLVLDTSRTDRGQLVRVAVEVTNPQNPLESASTELTLYIP